MDAICTNRIVCTHKHTNTQCSAQKLNVVVDTNRCLCVMFCVCYIVVFLVYESTLFGRVNKIKLKINAIVGKSKRAKTEFISKKYIAKELKTYTTRPRKKVHD